MGGGRSTTETRTEIPEELKPYAEALGRQLGTAIGLYPLSFLFQYRPMPVLPPSPEEMYLRNVIMGLPFGGQLPAGMTSYQGNIPYSNIFLDPTTAMKALPQIGQPPAQPTQPTPQQPDQPSMPQSIQDWLLTQQLAEIFGANFSLYGTGLGTPNEKSPFYNAWNRWIDNILEQQGLPVNDYTRNIAKKAYELSNYRQQ